MPFEALQAETAPSAKLSFAYIMALAGNVEAGTHSTEVTRYSGSINDPRARIVQKSTGEAEDHTIFLEGYASGDAFQRLIARGFITGEWADPDTWQGTVDETALTEYRGG